MKPTNGNESGCDPISSNCVIWQGPDLECINLCKGDTVSAVVNKLAKELCSLLDMVNVDSFNLSCLNLAECTPKDFTELIQLLIEQICDNNGIPIEGGAVSGCPDCEVSIAECFYYQLPTGDTATSMQLRDYVLAIGNQICVLTGSIGTINSTLSAYNVRISALEQAGTPTFTLPTMVPECVLPSTSVGIDVVLAAVEDQFCQLRTYTGDTNAIAASIQAACIGLSSADKLQGAGIMAQIPGWHAVPTNMAQSFSNLWKTVCDIRSAVQFIQANCCDSGCSAIDMQVNAQLTDINTLRLDFTGSIPTAYVDANPSSTISISDINGGGPQVFNNVNIKNTYFDGPAPYNITLSGVNGAVDLIVRVTLRLVNPITGATCETNIQTIALGTETCPTLILVSDYNAINYQFTWNGVIPKVVTMELYDVTGTILLQPSSLSIIDSTPNGSFINLQEGTDYKIRVVIDNVPCDFDDFTTLSYPCVAPQLNAPTLNYSQPEGNVDGNNVATWIAEYINLNP